VTLQSLIDKQDSFEIIRDQIAALIVLESANQQALALANSLDAQPWKLRVFSERAGPWESFPTHTDVKTPIVNVWWDSATYDAGASNIMERQKCDALYNIDVYGYGQSESVGAGFKAGDKSAAFEAQRALRLVRNILMAAENTYLGLRGLVWQRFALDVKTFQPQSDGQNVHHVVGARLVLRVIFNEFSPQVEPVAIESVVVKVTRAEDGEFGIPVDLEFSSEEQPPFVPRIPEVIPPNYDLNLVPALVWYNPKDVDSLTLEGDDIVAMADLTGNGFDVAHGDSSNRPVLAANGARFMEARLWGVGNNFAGKKICVFLVATENESPQQAGYFFGTSGSSLNQSLYMGPVSSSAWRFGLSKESFNVDFTNMNNTQPVGPFLFKLIFNENNKTTFLNGESKTTFDNSSLLEGNRDILVGAGLNDGGFETHNDCVIHEIIVLDNPTIEQIEYTETYLKTENSLTY